MGNTQLPETILIKMFDATNGVTGSQREKQKNKTH